jgi:hypothetical protein
MGKKPIKMNIEIGNNNSELMKKLEQIAIREAIKNPEFSRSLPNFSQIKRKK